MTQTAQILKVDKAGRVWTPREQRETVLDEFERSGLQASKFAAHIGVTPEARSKARRQGHAPQAAA